ncbi:helix-turn-helix domain-containing protein [Nocardia sp. NPDC051833]|uniref:PucR family transcriptional regulator n=1 Tax=Nocardia sp. NPDC051833 TaxID=3155674 RepID=UPI003434E4F4
MTSAATSPDIAERIGTIADMMLRELDQVVAEMDAAELEVVPSMGADATLVAEMTASNRANVAHLLSAFARRDMKVPTDIPPEALNVARTIVRRGIGLDAIYQLYHRGQHVAWRRFMTHAARLVPPGPDLVAILDAGSEALFAFVDMVVGRVIAEAQREREEVLGGELARRAEMVHLILDSAPVDLQRASERLRYELSRRHTALVVWCDTLGDVHGTLESASSILARAAGARLPLTLSAGTSTLWVWLATDANPALDRVRAAIDRVHPDIRIAVGPTEPGITGFRRSHTAALAVERVMRGYRDGHRIALYRDLEVAALASQDQTQAAVFVIATLGPLAVDTPGAARLRESLRVFLDEAENAPRAAARLGTHRNTVLQRVARATDLLGHRPGDRRLAVELALELAHQLGPRVLSRS